MSFARIGDPPISYQNNAFLIILVISAFFGLELKMKPFGITELNYLNWTSSLVMIFIIFGGLVSSINQETNLPFVMMIMIMILNIYFMVLFFRNYIQNLLAFPNDTKFYQILKKIFGKYWDKGTIFFLIDKSFLKPSFGKRNRPFKRIYKWI